MIRLAHSVPDTPLFGTQEAPVKAPAIWPKSSLSTRFSGMAPQLRTRKGSFPRLEKAWMALATRSLPVPVSPRISTVVLRGATVERASSIRRMGLESPRMLWASPGEKKEVE